MAEGRKNERNFYKLHLKRCSFLFFWYNIAECIFREAQIKINKKEKTWKRKTIKK
jgi:hypothetical protein